jgi:molybdate/tungstate transport system ATP-binding protein
MIRLKGVSKQYDKFALKKIDLEIKEGEYSVILGSTGAGKTLLLELIAGFSKPDEGSIIMFNNDVTNKPPEERGIGFVYQDYMLFPHLNVFDNIAFGLKLRKLTKVEIKRKIIKMAKILNITKLLHRDTSTLSGGESQRVALARALILKPKILLLDEPLSALDSRNQDKVRNEIRELHKKFKITTIHITHNRDEAIILGDKIIIIEKGSIHQVGTAEEVFRKPATRFVAEFVGVQNILSGVIEKRGQIKIKGLNGKRIYTTSELTGKVNIALRPEDIIISSEEVKTSARNVFHGRVKTMSDRGVVVSITVDVGRKFTIYITKQSLSELGITIGSKVHIMFKASAIHVF